MPQLLSFLESVPLGQSAEGGSPASDSTPRHQHAVAVLGSPRVLGTRGRSKMGMGRARKSEIKEESSVRGKRVMQRRLPVGRGGFAGTHGEVKDTPREVACGLKTGLPVGSGQPLQELQLPAKGLAAYTHQALSTNRNSSTTVSNKRRRAVSDERVLIGKCL